MKLNDVKIQSLSVPNRTIKILPGAKQPTFLAEILDVNFVGHVTGGMEVGPLQVFNFTEVRVEGLKMHFEFGVEKDSNATFWQVKAASVLDLKDMKIETDSPVFNSALQVFH